MYGAHQAARGARRIPAGMPIALLAGMGFLGAAVLAPVYLKLGASGFHAYDLGIYAQAIHAIRPGNLNPWISVVCTRIFNDHFDPIILLAAPWAKLFEPAYAAIAVEHLFVLACPLVLLPLVARGRISRGLAIPACLYLLLNRSTVSALGYPVHPTTWSVAAVVLLCAALDAERPIPAVGALFFLFLFREEFVLSGFALGAWHLVRGPRKLGVAVLALSLFWAAAVFVVRPALLGPVTPYLSKGLAAFGAGPAAWAGHAVGSSDVIRRILQVLAPLLPVFVWMRRSGVSPRWGMLAAVVPLLGVRLVSGTWQHHYMAPVSAFLLMSCAAVGTRSVPRWVPVSSVVLLALALSGPVQRAARVYGDVLSSAGAFSRGRLTALAEARGILVADTEGTVVAEGNLVPLLVRRPGIHLLGGKQTRLEEPPVYRFVFAETPPAGDPWPLDAERKSAILHHWGQTADARIIRQDEFVFLAEGRFAEP